MYAPPLIDDDYMHTLQCLTVMKTIQGLRSGAAKVAHVSTQYVGGRHESGQTDVEVCTHTPLSYHLLSLDCVP